MKPSKIEFKIGETIHKQPITLIYENDSLNKMSWTIYRQEGNQRDDSEIIRGIPGDVILKMAEAVKSTEANK